MTKLAFESKIGSFKGGIDPIDMGTIEFELTRNTTMEELEALEKRIPTYDDVIDVLDRAPRDWSPRGWIVSIDGTRLEFDESIDTIELSDLFEYILETKWSVDDEKFKSLRAAVYPLAYDWERHTPAYVTEAEKKQKFQSEFEDMMYDYQQTIVAELAKKHDVEIDWIRAVEWRFEYK
jgi:hypothetical protein